MFKNLKILLSSASILGVVLFLSCVQGKPQYDSEDRLIFCCNENVPSTSVRPPFQRTRTTPRLPVSTSRKPNTPRISAQMCKSYESCTDYPPILGIVGGLPAFAMEFRFIAALGWPKAVGGYLWGCAGSLISETYVITAAHCSYLEDTSLIETSPTMVRLGELDFSREDDRTEYQDIGIKAFIKHPQYTVKKHYNDIALVELVKKPVMNDYVWPLCLWQSVEDEEKPLYEAAGWGRTDVGKNGSDALLKVNLDGYSKEKCAEEFPAGKLRKLDSGFVDTQICAGWSYGGKDTCQGDSGGPLMKDHETKRCLYHLVGVTSFGIGCGSQKPAVYTRVASYLDWIESIVWRA